MKIILLPGLDGTGELFEPFIKALPDEIDTQIIPYPKGIKLSYEELIEFVVNKLPEEDFVLVGESFSGYIAYRISLLNPNFLRSVVFVASFLEPPRPYLLSLLKLLPCKLLLSLPIPAFLAKLFLFGNSVQPEMLLLFRHSLSTVSAEVLSFRLGEISSLPESSEASQINAIYIQAKNDKLVPSKNIEQFRTLFRKITIHQIDGSHFIMQTNPKVCADILMNI